MANKHFGKIGSVWKHLPLSELLFFELIHEYWETHSGAAIYDISHSWERDYGFYHFYHHSNRSSILKDSQYYQLLQRLNHVNGEPNIYPGSPYIAFNVLENKGKNYYFCDLEKSSLENINLIASDKGIHHNHFSLINTDGITTILEKSRTVNEAERKNIFVHIDPYHPFERINGMNSMELFFNLTKHNFKTMIWYGFDSLVDREKVRDEIIVTAKNSSIDFHLNNVWCGEIELSSIDLEQQEINPGVYGCGIMVGNMSPNTVIVCEQLGRELAKIYQNTMLPNGTSGSLLYSSYYRDGSSRTF